MKNNNSSSSGLTTVISVTVLALLTILAFLYVLGSFDKSNKAQDNDIPNEESVSLGDIPPHKTDTEDYFYTEDDLFAMISVQSSYSREFRVITIYGDDYSVERYRLNKSGNRFRAESDSKTVIFDGTELYCEFAGGVTRIYTDAASMYTELGITPLSEISESDSLETLYLSEDRKYLIVKTNTDSAGIHHEYKIAIDTGIVADEKSYIDGALFRSVVTDAYGIFGDDISSNDTFKIPE